MACYTTTPLISREQTSQENSHAKAQAPLLEALEAMRLFQVSNFAKSRNQSPSTLLLVSYGAALEGLKLLGASACHSVSKQGHVLPS